MRKCDYHLCRKKAIGEYVRKDPSARDVTVQNTKTYDLCEKHFWEINHAIKETTDKFFAYEVRKK